MEAMSWLHNKIDLREPGELIMKGSAVIGGVAAAAGGLGLAFAGAAALGVPDLAPTIQAAGGSALIGLGAAFTGASVGGVSYLIGEEAQDEDFSLSLIKRAEHDNARWAAQNP
jgi:hypothetical protein